MCHFVSLLTSGITNSMTRCESIQNPLKSSLSSLSFNFLVSQITLKPNIQRNVESIEIVISRYEDKWEKFFLYFLIKRNCIDHLDTKKALEKQVPFIILLFHSYSLETLR